MTKLVGFLLVVCSFSISNGQDDYYRKNWVDLFRTSRAWLKTFGTSYVNVIENAEMKHNLSASCASKLTMMIDKIHQEEWAAKMMDANGHLPSGILSGTFTDLGDFDQCVTIHSEQDGVEGKYCLLTISPKRASNFEPILLNDSTIDSKWFATEVNQLLELNNQVMFANGICFPSDCKSEEIRFLLSRFFPVLSHFDYDVQYCQTEETPRQSTESLIAMIIVKVAIALVIIGTALDLCFSRQLFVLDLLKCFSMHKNIAILFRISSFNSNREYRFHFIHGIRVLGTIWVIMAHTGGFVLVTILTKVSPFARYPEDPIMHSKHILSQYVMNASLAVQIFFIMSGMLTVYSTLSKKRLEISFVNFVLLRWLRFTPPLIGMLCFTIYLQNLGSGPLFHQQLIEPYFEPCAHNWWAHLLYIINWFDLRQMCGVQVWYLAADFQLHIMSFIVVYFFYKNQTISYSYSYLMIALGALAPILLVAIGQYGIPRVDVLFKPKYEIPGTETTLFFFGTHIHIISFFSGTIIGCALLNRQFVTIPKICNRIIWCLVIFLTITLPALSYPVLQDDVHPVNYTIGNSVALSIMLIIWSLCMSWFIYNCAVSQAGVLSKILSAKVMHPLSRLSFSAYLSHVMLIWFNTHQIRYPIAINVVTIVQYFCTVLVETFVVALILYLTFEAPFVNLIKLVFIGRADSKPESTPQSEENNNFSVDTNNRNNINLKGQQGGHHL